MSQRLRNTADYFYGSSTLHFVIVASGNSHRSTIHSYKGGTADDEVLGTSRHSHTHNNIDNYSLQDELLVNYQILSLLYLFPLATIEIIVQDVKWYIRQHYNYFDLLLQSGYISIDPFDPLDVDFRAYNNFPSSEFINPTTTDNTTSSSSPPLSPPNDLWKTLFNIQSVRQMESMVKILQRPKPPDAPIRRLTDGGIIPTWSPLYIFLPLGKVFTSPDALFRLTHGLHADSADNIAFLGKKDKVSNIDSKVGVTGDSNESSDECKIDVGLFVSPNVTVPTFTHHLLRTVTANHHNHIPYGSEGSTPICTHGHVVFANNDDAHRKVEDYRREVEGDDDEGIEEERDLDWVDVCYLYCDVKQFGDEGHKIDHYLISGVKTTPTWSMLRKSAEEQGDAGKACNCALFV